MSEFSLVTWPLSDVFVSMARKLYPARTTTLLKYFLNSGFIDFHKQIRFGTRIEKGDQSYYLRSRVTNNVSTRYNLMAKQL